MRRNGEREREGKRESERVGKRERETECGEAGERYDKVDRKHTPPFVPHRNDRLWFARHCQSQPIYDLQDE